MLSCQVLDILCYCCAYCAGDCTGLRKSNPRNLHGGLRSIHCFYFEILPPLLSSSHVKSINCSDTVPQMAKTRKTGRRVASISSITSIHTAAQQTHVKLLLEALLCQHSAAKGTSTSLTLPTDGMVTSIPASFHPQAMKDCARALIYSKDPNERLPWLFSDLLGPGQMTTACGSGPTLMRNNTQIRFKGRTNTP